MGACDRPSVRDCACVYVRVMLVGGGNFAGGSVRLVYEWLWDMNGYWFFFFWIEVLPKEWDCWSLFTFSHSTRSVLLLLASRSLPQCQQVVISVGFSLTVLFGTARWTGLLPRIPVWCIVVPCWSSHIGLLVLHVLSAQALSRFIADANAARQQPDSRDHVNRTEYLPLLQRSLKFGLKTGLLSLGFCLFEILVFLRVARGVVSLGVACGPLWAIVAVGILDGLICQSQHGLRVVCWFLLFGAMVLAVLRVDAGWVWIRWQVVVAPVLVVVAIATGTLIYIVYGHQIGYYRLTESQLTAANLYSLAALVTLVLVVMTSEVMPLSRPVEIETRVLMTLLAPLVVSLVGMGAWVVSRDEFGRLLLYGGQAAVHPQILKWEHGKGWTTVQGRGVTVLPMLGEVSFLPLAESQSSCLYPCQQDTTTTNVATTTTPQSSSSATGHPYLDATQHYILR